MTISTIGSIAPSARPQREPEPEECPDVYASIARGDCLEPVYHDGVCLVFSKTEKPKPGDFVGLWLRQDEVGPDRPARRVKRLVLALPDIILPCRLHPGSEVEPLVVVEQLNPPRTYSIGISHVLAIHKVIGTATEHGDGTARFVPAKPQMEGELL